MRHELRLGALSIALLLLFFPREVHAGIAPPPPSDPPFVAIAHLTSAQEVPPVTDTTAEGKAYYQLSADGTTLSYTFAAAQFTTPPIAAHIHAPAPPGTNAPVVAFLFPPNSNSSCPAVSTAFLFCSGRITAQNLVGPLAGHPLSDLIAQMVAGKTYTNAHTTRHPGGEVRGQNQTNQISAGLGDRVSTDFLFPLAPARFLSADDVWACHLEAGTSLGVPLEGLE